MKERDIAKKYESSGVSLKEAHKAVKKISEIVKETFTPSVLTQIGSFAAVYRPEFEDLAKPVLITSTDGIGTKIILHLKAGTLEAAGQDLVAMSANDILTLGARPLFFLDYIAGGKLDAEIVARFVKGIANACKKIGASLIGGETAEMPGIYREGDYDLSGFIVGAADLEKLPGPDKLSHGDLIIGLASSGPHSNGYSLIRKIMDDSSIHLEDEVAGTGRTFGDLILEPTVLYHPYLLALFEAGLVKSAAHITGGGFHENIARALPPTLDAVIFKGSFVVPPVFRYLQKAGSISEEEMYHVFNMGIGFVIFVSPDDASSVIEEIKRSGIESFIIGKVIEGKGRVKIVESD